VINIAMRKSSAAGKQIRPAPLRKKRTVVKEEEQLYLVRKSPSVRSNQAAAAAEFALKAHVLGSNPEFLAEMIEGQRILQEIAEVVDLTEAPEDAVCSLVADLLQYCEQEKIDWTQDVISRAWEHFRSKRACEVRKQ
jgi:hypothetical protein